MLTYFYFVYNEKCMAQVYILEFWHVCDFLLQPILQYILGQQAISAFYFKISNCLLLYKTR